MANILVVDDHTDLRDLVALILQGAGHQVREARDGREGMELVAEGIPDVALIDVEMPVLNGPEMVYELFLTNCGNEKIPIILLSGVVGLPEVAGLVGTPYFLRKPYSPEALLQMVERALQERIPPRPNWRHYDFGKVG